MSTKLAEPKLTKAEAAALVRRTVPKLERGKPVLDKDGQPMVEEARVGEDEVMAFVEYDDKVVVVTKDGQKLEVAKRRGGGEPKGSK